MFFFSAIDQITAYKCIAVSSKTAWTREEKKTYQDRMKIDAVQVEPFHSIQIAHLGNGWNESSAFVSI